jgi:hypothetical protein
VVLAAMDAAAGRPGDVRPISVGFLLRCVSLGRRRGLIQFVHADDEPRAAAFAGRAAALVKETVCRYTLTMLVKERTTPGAYRGVPGPRHRTPRNSRRSAPLLAPPAPEEVAR